MLADDKIKTIFADKGGVLRTFELHKARLYYNDIQGLIERGLIEKVRYGYYQWNDTWLFPDAIMCMETALFYYRYSDRTRFAWHLAVSKDSGKSCFKIDYPFTKPYYLEPSQEEFPRRLSKSKYAENFILKGGLLIYTLTKFESRATVDVDFLLICRSNGGFF